ncbi:MAG: cell envelope integrity protein TolA, partial [Haemophilus parainfluenzae]|nr:cell envelope integrity protein TolA [Haemophilus parainfluenzae]
MQNNRRKKRANEFVISIAMHLALFGLLIWSSLYQTVEIMGGGEGEGDAMGAVMVDTGSAAQEWGRIQQQKKGQTDKQKKPEPVVEEKKPEPEPEPNQQEIAKQEEIKRQQEIQRQKELEKQKQQEIEKQKQKQQQELARQEALE